MLNLVVLFLKEFLKRFFIFVHAVLNERNAIVVIDVNLFESWKMGISFMSDIFTQKEKDKEDPSIIFFKV